MADRLATVKFTGAGRCKYPWHEWTDGNGWIIWQGSSEEFAGGEVDYYISTNHMQIGLHQRARTRELVVQTERVHEGDKEGLKFQFVPLHPDRS